MPVLSRLPNNPRSLPPLVAIFSVLLAACSPAVAALPTAVPDTPTREVQAPTPTDAPTATASPSATPESSPTPDPYAGLTIEDLAARTYGGGQLKEESTLGVGSGFTRYLVSYPSDALTVYGFVDVPAGDGPFPVVLVLHGYVDPGRYQTVAYTARYAEALARLGYLVLHPNYRNHAPSDSGPNPFRVGYAIDVLNLVAIVREQAGSPGLLEKAEPGAIALMGHSMGGGIALRAIAVDPSIRAAVLYGSMSGDERKNHERILMWSNGTAGQEELQTPERDLQRISPIHHLGRIQAAVSVHHGEQDTVVPPSWSDELCDLLEALEKAVACHFYADQPHTFFGLSDQMLLQRVDEFLTENLSN